MTKKPFFASLYVVCLIGSAITSEPSRAGRLDAFATEEDLKHLPYYCTESITNGHGNPAVPHTHHYCAALNFMEHASRAKKDSEKRVLWERAIGQFEYCKGDAIAKNASVLPELYFLEGQAQNHLGQVSRAIQSYRNAIMVKPDFVQAYKALAHTYIKANMIPEAKAVALAGLRKSPNSQDLQRLLREIPGAGR